MMDAKTRLFNAINKTEIDRIPCICPGGMMNMITKDLMDTIKVYLPEAHSNAEKMAELAKSVYDNACFENYGVPFCMTVEAEDMGAIVDMGSDIYEPHVIKYAIKSVDDWKNIKPIDPEKSRSKIVLDAIKILKKSTKDVPIVGNLTGPVSTASSLMEPTDFYKELRKKNKSAHEFMDYVTNQLIAFAKDQVEAGADIIAISDPSGTGEILGPKFFSEFVVTYMNNIIDSLKDTGVKTIVHICGQMGPVLDRVNEIKADVLSFDSIVPVKTARSHLQDRVLMGNVSTFTIEFGNAETVKKLTKSCLKNGVNILSPACGIGMKSPIKNIQTMLETLKET